jgi:hypothetical protein
MTPPTIIVTTIRRQIFRVRRPEAFFQHQHHILPVTAAAKSPRSPSSDCR